MPTLKDHIRLIAFDTDDTLWTNEPHYLKAQDVCAEILLSSSKR